MAKRIKSPGRERATFKLFGGRTQNPVGTATFLGRSYKKALASGKRYLRNVAAGFWDDSGFHPIRASSDYSSKRVGEGVHRAVPKRRGKTYTKKRKATKRRPRRKTNRANFGQRMARLRARKKNRRRVRR